MTSNNFGFVSSDWDAHNYSTAERVTNLTFIPMLNGFGPSFQSSAVSLVEDSNTKSLYYTAPVPPGITIGNHSLMLYAMTQFAYAPDIARYEFACQVGYYGFVNETVR